MSVERSRLHKIGRARYILLPKVLHDVLGWRDDEWLAIRPAGDKLIIERIPREQFAVLRGTPQEVRS